MSDQSDYDDVVVKGPEYEEHPSQKDIAPSPQNKDGRRAPSQEAVDRGVDNNSRAPNHEVEDRGIENDSQAPNHEAEDSGKQDSRKHRAPYQEVVDRGHWDQEDSGETRPPPPEHRENGKRSRESPQGTVEDAAWTPHPRIVEMNGEWPGQTDAGSIRIQILPPLPEGTEEDRKNGIGPQGAPAERFARQTRAPPMNQTMRDTGLRYPKG